MSNHGEGRKRALGLRTMLALGAALSALGAGAAAADEWAAYGHDAGGARFSPLTQINRSNVTQLKVAWVFHTGDIADGSQGPRSGFETTPHIGRQAVHHHAVRPGDRARSRDGAQVWAFDPHVDKSGPTATA